MIAVVAQTPFHSIQNITLDAAGDHCFICMVGSHCSLGQKLAINVTGSSSSSPAPSPTPTTPASAPAPATTATPPASAPTPPPSRSPVTYTVGDTTGWSVFSGAAAAYASWASGKTFMVGDILVFNFANQAHNVAEVTKDAYDSSNTTSPLSLETNPPVRITLTTAGEHYYICTISNHCSGGQKLAINVTGSSTAKPPSSTATPPSSIAVPLSTPTTPNAPPPKGRSAKSPGITGLSATILSIAVALWI